MPPKLDLIVAMCENMGIGKNGNLPWRIKAEMAFFVKITSSTKDENKRNVVLMGKKTWESIPEKFRPLKNRINIVLSSTLRNNDESVIVTKSFDAAINQISSPPMRDKIERVWVIGGSSVYKAALESKYIHRLYITRIKKNYDCDVYFPGIPENFMLVEDKDVPKGIMEENGIEYCFEVYEKKHDQT